MSGAAATNGHTPANVLLIGLGSIGSVYAFMLERSGRARVTAVARSNYDLYTRGGVTLITEKFGRQEGWRPYRVVRSQAEAFADGTTYDFCLVTTKCLPDVTPTPVLLADAIASEKVGAWSLIQNGLGIEEDLYQAVKHLDTPIISGLGWIGVMTSPDGATINWRGQEVLVSGLYPPISPSRTFSARETAAMNHWVDLIQAGGGTIKTTDHVDSIRFSKNIWNCAWSSIQGLARTRPASWADMDPAITQPMRDFMREIVDVGFDSGLLKQGMIQYPQGTTVGSREEVAESCWEKIVSASVANAAKGGGHKMSLWVDVEMGRPIEVEVITGAVVKIAQQHGLKTPLLDYTYALLKGLQVEILQQQAARRAAAGSVEG